jgi:hypothetical protein
MSFPSPSVNTLLLSTTVCRTLNQFFFKPVAFGGANICNQRRENNLVLSIVENGDIVVVLYRNDVYKNYNRAALYLR